MHVSFMAHLDASHFLSLAAMQLLVVLYPVLLKGDAWKMHDEVGISLGGWAYKTVRRVISVCLVFCYIDALLILTAAKYGLT